MTKREFLEQATMAWFRSGKLFEGTEYGSNMSAWLKEKGAMAVVVAAGAYDEINKQTTPGIEQTGIEATWLRAETMAKGD